MIKHINAIIESIKNMSSRFILLSIYASVPLLLCVSCWSDLDDMHGKIGEKLHYAGEKDTYTSGGVSFKMTFVPGGRTFPTGVDDNGDTGASPTPVIIAPTAVVPKAFWMAETEVTYELWFEVHTWAIANGYYFANPGRQGGRSIVSGPVGTDQHPVTTINWRDAMVWCNALTEYYNANNGGSSDLDCVYYSNYENTIILKDSSDGAYSGSINSTPGGHDNPYVKSNAKGFRLPGNLEWDMAARYKDGVSWTPGSWASGASADYTDFTATRLVAWFGNSTIQGTGNTETTQPVKSKKENALGLYDMSGNVWEWCFDWGIEVEVKRSARSGSWFTSPHALRVGRFIGQTFPYDESESMGFRFARTE